jgi:hypothetical protein
VVYIFQVAAKEANRGINDFPFIKVFIRGDYSVNQFISELFYSIVRYIFMYEEVKIVPV